MVWKLGKEMVKAGKVKPGLTIHGLRHSLGKQLYDLGLEREQRKAMMSHQSDQASIVYERDGDRSAQTDAAVVKLDRSLRKRASKGKPKRRSARSVHRVSEHERNEKVSNYCDGECLTVE